jgi:23S rRNA (guanosine2251-2'-O)-methyltransferase
MSHKEFFIFGRKPIVDALREGKRLDKILLLKTATGDEAKEIQQLAHQAGVPVQKVPKEKIDGLVNKYSKHREANHQGVLAFLSIIEYYSVDDALNHAYSKNEVPLFLILDGVTDVGNFGAIARSSECFGVHAIIIPAHGAAQINAEAIKTSAGALDKILVCREKSLITAIRFLKLSGVKIYGTDMRKATTISKADFKIPTAIVLGNEGEGISKEVMSLCDDRICIPMLGKTESLNVSVSAGVILYEVQKQRTSK